LLCAFFSKVIEVVPKGQKQYHILPHSLCYVDFDWTSRQHLRLLDTINTITNIKVAKELNIQ